MNGNDHDPQPGGIALRLGNLEGTLRTFMQQWRDQDNAAGLGRRVIHEKLELLSLQVTRLATDIQNVQQDLAELRMEVDEKVMPTIGLVQAEQHRKIGAKGTWAIIATACMAAISFLAWAVDKLVTYMFHKP